MGTRVMACRMLGSWSSGACALKSNSEVMGAHGHEGHHLLNMWVSVKRCVWDMSIISRSFPAFPRFFLASKSSSSIMSCSSSNPAPIRQVSGTNVNLLMDQQMHQLHILKSNGHSMKMWSSTTVSPKCDGFTTVCRNTHDGSALIGWFFSPIVPPPSVSYAFMKL